MDKKELRKFGVGASTFLFVISALFWWRGKLYLPFFILALFFLIFALIYPNSLKPVFYVFQKISKVFGKINTVLLLSLIFFVLIVPVSLVAKLLKKDFLAKSWQKDKKSYWLDRKKQAFDPDDFEKQY